MRIAIVVGTRPEIIKMAPVVRAAQSHKRAIPLLWHTGQHYSFEMDKQIFNDLGLPDPDVNMHVGSGTHATQTGEIMVKLEKLMLEEQPDVVLVQGDTNTVLGASLTAAKLHIPVGHIEAGLRSYDRAMPEEINRIACDHIADVLYPPTEKARAILEHEGIEAQKIIVTGNTAVDAALQSLEIAKHESRILDRFAGKSYIFLTMHRAENVDNEAKLTQVIHALEQLLNEHEDLEIIWSVHPRTQKQIEAFNLDKRVESLPRVHTMQPPGYLDTLLLQSGAKLIMTDSGGIQEEACVLGVPCITLRDNTERPESVDVGANELVGTSTKRIVAAVSKHWGHNESVAWKNPFGDGKAGERIIDDLLERFA